MAMSKIDRIDREIEKTRGKITEYQNRLKELEAQRTEQENFEIVNLVRSMCMSRDELMSFLRGGGNDATRAELILLISAAFGVGAGKISVAEAN